MKKEYFLLGILSVILLAAGVWIYQIISEYQKAEREYEQLQEYVKVEKNTRDPENTKPNVAEDDKEGEKQEETVTVDFASLQAINPDIVAWLRIPGVLEYPVVRGKDNSYYLNHTVQKTYNIAGSIFLDAKSDRNFHDFYTVIMGHHMQGRKMFGDIDLYTDVSFFEKNTTGTLYVEGRILKLETVAILKADAYDKYVYRTDWKEKEEKEELIRHIYELAVHTRGQRLTVEDQMIALSTCSSGNTNGRHLLICKVIKENTVEGSETE